MSETVNYGLYIEDNDQTTFKYWREKMNGPDESNMVIIDRILKSKADSSRTVDCVLSKDGWSDIDGLLTQTLDVAGLNDTQNGNIALSPVATKEERAAARAAILSLNGQATGFLTVVADGEQPQIDIPVVLTMID